MERRVTKTAAGAFDSAAVEQRPLQKRGASENPILKSRGNFGKMFCFVAIAVILSSCKSTNFYQVYQVKSVNEVSKNSNSLIYEDENCKVFYDFWGIGGDVGILIHNKTDENIYIDKKESFFIKNGIAYDYFRNRTFTTTVASTYSFGVSALDSEGISASKAISGRNYLGFKQTNSITAAVASSVSASAGAASSVSSSVSVEEEPIICIPPKTAKVISEYCVTNSLFRDCDLLKYPSGRNVKTMTFSNSDSPFVFSNLISYKVGNSDKLISFENNFYVSAITNYPESEVIYKDYTVFCGERRSVKSEFFKSPAPDKFYIQYTKAAIDFKH
jgi:hypothetical protein